MYCPPASGRADASSDKLVAHASPIIAMKRKPQKRVTEPPLAVMDPMVRMTPIAVLVVDAPMAMADQTLKGFSIMMTSPIIDSGLGEGSEPLPIACFSFALMVQAMLTCGSKKEG
jgi:hypothetical protein